MFPARYKWNLGLATDEAILVGAMVASAGAFGVVAFSWEGLSASVFDNPETIVGQLHRIEQANVNFRKHYAIWPTQTTNGDPAHNLAALVDKSVMRYPYSNTIGAGAFLPEAKQDKTRAVTHGFGEGGRLLQQEVAAADGHYIEVIVENVPINIAQEVDEVIDGSYTPLAGRVILKVNDSRRSVNIHYIANKINS